MKTLAILSLPVIAVVGSPRAQDLVPRTAPQSRPVVIENATIHVGNGETIVGGKIWFDGGRILGVARDASGGLPQGAERIDAHGLHVYPGMISAFTTLGISEVGSVPATQDTSEIGDITPEVRAAVAINPDSTTIPVARANGVLSAAVLPSGGLVPGRLSVIQLEGWTWEDMTISSDAGLVVAWPSSGRSGGRFRGRRPGGSENDATDRSTERRQVIDRAFKDAKAYLDAREADPTVALDLRYDAMAAVLSGQKPVFLLADDAEQIQSAVEWAIELGLRPTIVGGREAGLCIEFLKEYDVPVIVTGTLRLPRRRDIDPRAPFELPARLEAAGIRWCLATTGGSSNERNLPYHAAKAVAYGLPVDAALRSVTAAPAELLGVGDRLGTLEKGKLATLIVTDGNPLEIVTRIRAAFVAGRRIDLSSKHSALADKYREKYRQLGLLPDGR
jgi:imidazolonepropionase-like amidohydrolase